MFFLILINFTYAAECYHVQVKVISVDINFEKEGEFPNFREGDYLFFDSIHVENHCYINESSYQEFIILLKKPDGKNIIFQSVIIPPLKENEIWTLSSIKENPPWDFVDSLGNRSLIGGIKLDNSGDWISSATFISMKNRSEQNNKPDFSIITADNKNLGDNNFRVTDRYVYDQLEFGKLGYGISILALVLTIVQIILTCIQIKENKKDLLQKQISILGSIQNLVTRIKEDINGHKAELDRKTIPSYPLEEISPGFYLMNINYQIKKNNTKNLKDLILKANSKIKTINNLQDWLIQSMNLKNRHLVNNFMKELRKDPPSKKYKYYDDLLKILKNVEEEISKFMVYDDDLNDKSI